MLKRRLTFILGLLLVVGGIGTCRKLSSSRTSPPRREMPTMARAVRTLTAVNGPVQLAIPITGRLRAMDRMTITAEVSGTLLRTSKPFREGVSFRQGEVLFKVDDAEVRAQINAQQSAFLRALVQLVPDLRIDLPKAAPRWEAYLQSVPVEGQLPLLPKLVDEQERNYLAGRGVLDQYYTIRSLYERLGRYTVTAPFDGVVVAAGVEPGTIVTPGVRLGELIAPQLLELETSVNAAELPLLKVGDTLSIPEGNGRWSGKVTRIGAAIDAATQTVKVFAQLKGDGLHDGQYITGTIITGAVDHAVGVPRAALLDDGTLYTVKDSLLVRNAVSVVYQGLTEAVVRGLDDGQEVVVDRLSDAHEGMRVAPVKP